MKVKTPEEIQSMREEIAAFDAKQAQERADAQREKAKVLIDTVGADGFKALEDAVPALEELANDREAFPYLRDHVAAVRNGLFGLRQTAEMFAAPAVPVVPAVPAAPAGE